MELPYGINYHMQPPNKFQSLAEKITEVFRERELERKLVHFLAKIVKWKEPWMHVW